MSLSIDMISKHASDWLVILSIHTFSSFPRMSRMDVCVGGHHHRYPKPHAWPGMGSFRKIQEALGPRAQGHRFFFCWLSLGDQIAHSSRNCL